MFQSWSKAEWKEFLSVAVPLFVALPLIVILSRAVFGASYSLSTAVSNTILWGTGLIILAYTIETHRMRREMARQTRVMQFDRRIEVVHSIRRFFETVCRDARLASFDPMYDLITKTSESGALFDAAIAGYIDEIRHRAIRLYHAATMLREPRLPVEQRTRLVEEEGQGVAWMDEQRRNLNERFRGYLTLDA